MPETTHSPEASPSFTLFAMSSPEQMAEQSADELREILERLPHFEAADLSNQVATDRLDALQSNYRAKATTGEGTIYEVSDRAGEVEKAFAKAGIFVQRPDGELGWVDDTAGFSKKLLAELEQPRVAAAWTKVQDEIYDGLEQDKVKPANRHFAVVSRLGQGLAEGQLLIRNSVADPEGKEIPDRIHELGVKLVPNMSRQEQDAFVQDVFKAAAGVEKSGATRAAQRAAIGERLSHQQEARAEEARKVIAAQEAKVGQEAQAAQLAADTTRQEERDAGEAAQAKAAEHGAYMAETTRITERYKEPIRLATAAGDAAEVTRLRGEEAAAYRKALGRIPELGQEAVEAKQWDEALTADRGARAQNRVREEFEQRIAATQDEAMKVALRKERDQAVVDIANRMKIVGEQARTISTEVWAALRDRRESARRIDQTAPDLEETAAALHDTLQLTKVPFRVEKAGGWRKSRGPRVTEAYYRSARDPNLIVVERHVARGGKLLSQTAITTEASLQDLGKNRYRFPRGFSQQLDVVRDQDNQLPTPSGSRLRHRFGVGAANVGDFNRTYYGASVTEATDLKRRQRRQQHPPWYMRLFGG